MALHGPIMVNSTSIGGWAAVRNEGQENPGPDDKVTYACTVVVDRTLQGNPRIEESFTIEHRFGDGALKLAALVLYQAYEIAEARK